MNNLDYTGFLFSLPSFKEGVASIIDFGGNLIKFNESKSAMEANKKALKSDWLAICDDFRVAVEENVK